VPAAAAADGWSWHGTLAACLMASALLGRAGLQQSCKQALLARCKLNALSCRPVPQPVAAVNTSA
jgi:hypothetical protein